MELGSHMPLTGTPQWLNFLPLTLPPTVSICSPVGPQTGGQAFNMQSFEGTFRIQAIAVAVLMMQS